MSAILDQDVAAFETHWRALTGLAYRMLGSRIEAGGVVKDAYLRWHAADRTAIEEPRRYLGTVVTRLYLDRMKSARARREIYVGRWPPEPVVDEAFEDVVAPAYPYYVAPAYSYAAPAVYGYVYAPPPACWNSTSDSRNFGYYGSCAYGAFDTDAEKLGQARPNRRLVR